MVDFHRKAFVTKANGVRSDDVDEVPCDVAGLVHRAQLGHRFVGAFVPYRRDFGIVRDVRLHVRTMLRLLIRTAPRHERDVIGQLGRYGGRTHRQGEGSRR